MNEIPARERMVLAVIECIEKYGIDKTTTRRIAETAGVNVASINYYFRSKDELIDVAMATSIEHMVGDVTAIIDRTETPVETILFEVFRYLIEGSIRFPGLSASHLYSGVSERRFDAPGVTGLRQVYENLSRRVCKAFPEKDAEVLRFVLSRIFYAIFIDILAPDILASSDRFRLSNDTAAEVLAKVYVSLFLSAISSDTDGK